MTVLGLRFARALRFRVFNARACTRGDANPFATRAFPPASPPATATGDLNSCPHCGQIIPASPLPDCPSRTPRTRPRNPA